MRIFRFISFIAALVVILSVSAFADAPVITAQPQNVFFPSSQEFPAIARFSLMATGDNLSYQWQGSSNNGVTWHNVSVSSGTTDTLTLNVYSSSVGNHLYRCVVSSTDGETVSQVVSVSVGGYLMDTIPQMLVWGSEIIDSIFVWIGSACASIIGTPILLIGVSFFSLGAAIAILNRLLSRS